jgi:hypothetical protein
MDLGFEVILTGVLVLMVSSTAAAVDSTEFDSTTGGVTLQTTSLHSRL